MKIFDNWGNEFESEEEAEEYWEEQWWGLLDEERLAECLNLDIKIAEWLMKDNIRWCEFIKAFSSRFNSAIKDYIEDCYYESEIEDD
jgi:hypothetical protein